MSDAEADRKNVISIIYNYEMDVKKKSKNIFRRTVETLDDLERLLIDEGFSEKPIPQDIGLQWYTRLASALTEYATDRNTIFELSEIKEICYKKHVIVPIFAASGYRDMSHLASLMSTKGSESRLSLSLEKALVLLTFVGIDDIPDELLEPTLGLPPEYLFPLLIGWLGERIVITKKGEENRKRLLTCGKLIEGITPENKDLPYLTRSYMHCTYSEADNKHEIKKYFNEIYRNWLSKIGIKDHIPKDKKRERPLILVILEHFGSAHAMFRCYEPIIKSLRDRFEVFGLCPVGEVDAGSLKVFDNIIQFDKKKMSLKVIVAKIIEISPDIIYFPSVGMEFWVVALSNIRLARIQVAHLGHPATTKSDKIDFIFTHDDRFKRSSYSVFSEIPIILKEKPVFFLHEIFKNDISGIIRENSDNTVNVAVNSSSMKLSYRLIDICIKLKQTSTTKFKFHFFPAVRGLYFDGIRSMIEREVPDAIVHPAVPYRLFIEKLALCDMSLAAFPFGNTNGTVDACLLGIPTIAHLGVEPPSTTDRLVLEAAGFPLWLVNDNDADYLECAKYVANNLNYFQHMRSRDFRESVMSSILSSDIKESKCSPSSFFDFLLRNYGNMESSDFSRINDRIEMDNI